LKRSLSPSTWISAGQHSSLSTCNVISNLSLAKLSARISETRHRAVIGTSSAAMSSDKVAHRIDRKEPVREYDQR
jgi:hypothetical protein